MQRHVLPVVALFAFGAGILFAACTDGGGIGVAEAATDCAAWEYYGDAQLAEGECTSPGNACEAPTGWEPAGGVGGWVLMRKCVN